MLFTNAAFYKFAIIMKKILCYFSIFISLATSAQTYKAVYQEYINFFDVDDWSTKLKDKKFRAGYEGKMLLTYNNGKSSYTKNKIKVNNVDSDEVDTVRYNEVSILEEYKDQHTKSKTPNKAKVVT